MDLTNNHTIKTTYAVDPDTNLLTIEFKTDADVLIDSIIIEDIKYKPLIAALLNIAQERWTNPQIKGPWDASTNSPTLANSGMPVPPIIGDTYFISKSGTQNLGAGSQAYYAGTWIMYDSSKWITKHADTDSIRSVVKYYVNDNSAEITFV
jgi:hypothetical protein